MHLLLFALSFILSTGVAYAAAAAAGLQSAHHVLDFMAFSADPVVLERRQDTECVRVTYGDRFCERSCGSLFTACVSTVTCYAPSLGQSCCADGSKQKDNPASRLPLFYSVAFFWLEETRQKIFSRFEQLFFLSD